MDLNHCSFINSKSLSQNEISMSFYFRNLNIASIFTTRNAMQRFFTSETEALCSIIPTK